jgi:transcriptional regulator with XRE-family HTH domain
MEPLTPRDILARNVRQLIDKEGQSLRAWALARELDVKLIERIAKASHSVTIDKIEEVANAVGVPAWQLLLPDFEPDMPTEAPLTNADKELLGRLKRLLGSE